MESSTHLCFPSQRWLHHTLVTTPRWLSNPPCNSRRYAPTEHLLSPSRTPRSRALQCPHQPHSGSPCSFPPSSALPCPPLWVCSICSWDPPFHRKWTDPITYFS